MTRLIYADALKEVFKEKGSEAVCGVELCKAIISQIDNQPTVDAIPVEWINKYANEHRTYMHAFSEMVACWYDEKEKREYEMASDMRDYCEKYEPTYNPEDGSL